MDIIVQGNTADSAIKLSNMAEMLIKKNELKAAEKTETQMAEDLLKQMGNQLLHLMKRGRR